MDHDSLLGGTSKEGARKSFMFQGREVLVFAGGDGTDDPPKNDPPKADPPKDDPPAFKPPQSQEDFDRMVQDRLQRERKKYEGFDEIKQKAEEFDKLQAANQSEQEKLQTALEAEKQRAAKLEDDLKTTRVTNAVVEHAEKLNLADPRAAARLVNRSDLEYDDDGTPKADSVKAALTKLVEEYPILKGSRFQGGGDGGARGNGSGSTSMNDLIRQKAGR